jgi:hypothetical protein
MTNSGSSPEDELTRLAIRVISAAQGALETVLAPGGVVETIGATLAGVLDEVSNPRPEVLEQLGAAVTALGRAWQALVFPPSADDTEQPAPPPISED